MKLSVQCHLNIIDKCFNFTYSFFNAADFTFVLILDDKGCLSCTNPDLPLFGDSIHGEDEQIYCHPKRLNISEEMIRVKGRYDWKEDHWETYRPFLSSTDSLGNVHTIPFGEN